MAHLLKPTPLTVKADGDQVSAIQQVLRDSDAPLTAARIRAALPPAFRSSTEALTDLLQRQVSAAVLYSFPRYRGQQERYWDRPMSEHVAELIRALLAERSLGLSGLRRKLPAYAQDKSADALTELLERHEVYRHPHVGRGRDRYGLEPPDVRDWVRPELNALFERLGQLGFSRTQLQAAALELLHEAEWISDD